MPQLPDFKRDITNQLRVRLAKPGSPIQIIRGPRQVGKTTAVQQVLAELKVKSVYGTADLPAPPDISWIRREWETARHFVKDGKPVILVLDEVQKVDRWSHEVKRLWDEDRLEGRDIRVVILGSSSLLLQKGLTESLAGRFEILRCSHWTYPECATCFGWNLEQFIYFGGYPGAARFIDDHERWAAFVRDSLIETAISKDVLLLNPVEKPALLRKLFVLACEYGGQILSYQKVLGQLSDAGNTTTIANYERLLQAAYLIAGLEKYSGSKIRMRGSSPKWLPLSTALISALSRKSFLDTTRDPQAWGRLVECAVGAYLFYEADKHGMGLFYWRRGIREVDFILQKGKELNAIEVKTSLKKTMLDGLAEFEKEYQPYRSIVVGPSGIPIDEFLSTDAIRWFK